MTKFINLGRYQAENFTYQENWACISITSPGSPDTEFICPYLSGVIRLKFHDAERNESKLDIITDEQAMDMVRFVKQFYGKVSLIVVHCEAGISRSAAVAAAFTNYYTGNDSYFFKFFCPNMTVYSATRLAIIDYVEDKKE